MKEKNNDLHLRFKFNDIDGADVYDAFAGDDRLEMQNKLFEVRLNAEGQTDQAEVTWSSESKVESHGTG